MHLPVLTFSRSLHKEKGSQMQLRSPGLLLPSKGRHFVPREQLSHFSLHQTSS